MSAGSHHLSLIAVERALSPVGYTLPEARRQIDTALARYADPGDDAVQTPVERPDMIGVIATLSVRPGKQAEFEAVFARLAAQVRADEPGNIFYQLCRSRESDQTYKVLEQYRDQAALDAHRASAHFRAAGPLLTGVLAGAPVVELLDAV
jgi:quinol monooxygenase YgiN